MPSFRESRDFLLARRTDYAAAYAGFRWPDAAAFNWALDWFDADLATRPETRDRPALWIVDAASGAETKVSFSQMSRRSNQVANRLRSLGLRRGDTLLLLLGNVPALWETMLAAM
ncbi:MAG: AMP-dependent synthetase, partial [Methylobacterium sp.]